MAPVGLRYTSSNLSLKLNLKEPLFFSSKLAESEGKNYFIYCTHWWWVAYWPSETWGSKLWKFKRHKLLELLTRKNLNGGEPFATKVRTRLPGRAGKDLGRNLDNLENLENKINIKLKAFYKNVMRNTVRVDGGLSQNENYWSWRWWRFRMKRRRKW